MNVIVNGRTVPLDKSDVTYEDICLVAGEDPQRVLTMTYHWRRKGTDESREGCLIKGRSVRAEEGMIFNVADTSNA